MPTQNLTNAKKAKNDEFYTQYHYIEKEVATYIEYNPNIFRGKTILSPCDDPEWSNFTKFFSQALSTFKVPCTFVEKYSFGLLILGTISASAAK